MLDAGDRSCVLEATSIAGAKGRLEGTFGAFAVLVFTNLTQDHLDFHGSMEEYYAAKRALFDQAERVVVNVGDEWGARLAAELPDARTFTPGDDLEGVDPSFEAGSTAPTRWARSGRRELGIDSGTRSW